jgi:hypothetical protein
MSGPFKVGHLSIDRLMNEWRWLCPQPVALVARAAFGDLFLRDDSGKIFKLDVSVGQLTQVCESEREFWALTATTEKRQEWFREDDVLAAARRGLKPNEGQCIAFKIPVMFAESGKPANAYLADLYEQVSFLGDLNRQVSTLPDGAKIRLTVKD